MARARHDIQWGLRRAKKAGLKIVEPAPNELMIDIDGAAELAFYRQQMQVLRKNLKAAEAWTEKITPSKTPGKFHVVINFGYDVGYLPEAMTNAIEVERNVFRVAFQAILGSDLRRECFNLCRVLSGTKYPIALFEKEK